MTLPVARGKRRCHSRYLLVMLSDDKRDVVVPTRIVTAVYVGSGWYDVEPGSFDTLRLTYESASGRMVPGGSEYNFAYVFVDAHSGTQFAGPLSAVQAIHYAVNPPGSAAQ